MKSPRDILFSFLQSTRRLTHSGTGLPGIRTRKQFRALFENMLNGLAYCQMHFEQNQPQDFTYLEVNRAFETLTGLKNVVGRRVSEVIPGIREADPELFEMYGRVALTGVPEHLETFVDALGMWFSIAAYSPKKEYFVAVFDVITERKRAEQELRRVNRALQTISECNQVIVRASEESHLLQDICGILVHTGGFRMAWVGYGENDEGKSVPPAAHAGFEEGFLQTAGITWADTERGRGPTGAAIRTGKAVVARDYQAESTLAPWREEAGKRGYASSIALPIVSNGHVLGALSIYAKEPDAFDSAEVELLTDLSDDLAYGIHALRTSAERKRVEEALQDQKAFTEAVMESLPGTFYVLDSKGRFSRMNKRAGKALGYSSEEFAALDPLAIIAEDERPLAANKIQEALAKGSSTGDFHLLAKDGRRIPYLLTSMRADIGGKVYLAGMAIDISDRKQAEEGLIAERHLLHTLMDNLPDLIYFKDRESHFTRINLAVANKLGLSHPNQAVGKTDFDFFGAEYAKNFFKDEEEIIRTGRPMVGKEEKVAWADGHVGWGTTTKMPLRDANGNIVGTFGVSRDITARKRAEEALIEEQHLLHTLMDNLPDVIYFKDRYSRFTRINKAHAKQFGLNDPAQAVGKSDFDFFDAEHAQDAYGDEQEIIRTGQAVVDKEEKEIRPDGRVTWASTTKMPLRDANGNIIGTFGVSRDITDRKRVEEELRASRQLLQTTLDSLCDAVFVLSPEKSDILDCNRAATEMFGYCRDEMLGKNVLLRHVDQDSLEEFRRHLYPALAENGYLQQFEFRMKRKDGTIFSTSHAVTPLLDKQGQRTGWVSVVQDITERKRAEESLRESEERFRATFENAGVGMALVDMQGHPVKSNPALRQMLGYSEEELSHMAFTAFTHPDDRELDWELYSELTAGKRDKYEVEKRYLQKGGGVVWGLLTVSLVRSRHGRPAHAVGMVQDITERKLAEEALRKSEERFRLFMDNTPTVAWIKDEQGRYVYISGTYEKQLGARPEDRVGKTDFEVYPRAMAEQFQKNDQAALAAGHPIEVTEKSLTSEGAECYWLNNKFTFQEASGQVFVAGIGLDVTERKRAEEALIEERHLLHTLMDNLPDVIYFKDREGHFTRINKALVQRFGMSDPAQAVGKTDFDFFTEEHAREFHRDEEEIIRTGQPVVGKEEKEIWRDGHVSWAATTKMPLRDANGDIVGTFGVSRDITERKRAEEALRESEEKYRSLVSNIPDVAWTLDSELHFGFISKNIERVSGYSQEEVYQAGIHLYLDSVHPDDVHKVGDGLRALFAEGRPFDVECRVKRKDGEWVWVHDRALASYEKNGIKYADGLLSDITERKRVEEALRLTQFSMEHASDAIFWMDSQGRILYVNEAACRSLGRSREELLSLSIPDIDPLVPKKVWEPFWELVKRRGSRTFETQHQSKQGRVFPVEITANYVEFGGKEYSFAFAHDITERKRAEEALRKANAYNRSLIEASLDPLVTISPDGVITDVNLATEKITGVSRSELIGTDFSIYFVNPDKARAGYQQVFREGNVKDYELEIRHREGHVTPVIYSASLYRDEDGKVIGVFAAARDITERKRAFEAISRLATIVESSDDAIISVTLEGVITSWNKGAERLYGYSTAEVLGQSVSILIPPDRSDEVGQLMASIQQGAFIQHRETVRIRKDGSLVDVSLSLFPLTDSRGEAIGIASIARDITEHKRIEKAVLESEERYRSLFENAPLGIYRTTPDGRILAGNPALVRMFGYSSFEELASRDLNAGGFEPEYPRSQFMEILEERGEVTGLESAWRKQNGEIVHVRENARAIRDDSGRILHYEGTAEDITEQTRMLAELQKQQNFVEAVLDCAQSGIIACDDRGVLTLFNQATHELFGLPSKDISAEQWAQHFELYLADGKTLMKKEEIPIFRALRGERLSNVEMVIVPKHGKPRDVLASGQPIIDSRGRNLGAVVAFHDITERKQAEAEHIRLVTAIEQSAEAVMITNFAGDIEYINPAFTLITGYSRDEVLGQNPRILKSHEQDLAYYQQLWATILKGEIWHGELVNRRKNGNLYTEQMTVAPVRGESGEVTHFIATKQDVTARRQLEQQFIQAQKMEAVGRLAGGVAHDFNNLLTIINGYAALLTQKTPTEDPRYDHLAEIVMAGERAATLTRQLLAFSRRQVLEPRVLDLNTVLADVEKMLRRLIGEDVVLESRLNPDLGRVKVDPGQIEQVVMNLAVNARDAMPKGGKFFIETSNAEIDEAYARSHSNMTSGNYVMLAVSDTGCGMDQKTQARIFEPFFTTKEKGRGTGLGLATVYGIVKQSGGFIWVYSEPGRGSAFKIYFPRVEDAVPKAEPAKVRTKPTKGSETVLVVEDEKGVLSLVSETLKSEGYKLLEAEGVEQALEIAEQYTKPIHLLLTDVVMPQSGGKELAQRLSARHPETRVLYMSGYTDDAIVRHGILEDGTSFLQKPFTPSVLARKVREVLKKKPGA